MPPNSPTRNDLITPVILSGGSGTRLWPISTPERPKQFLSLTGLASMFQLTLRRCQDESLFGDPIVVGNADHAELAENQMREVDANAQAMILEPCARNTAPAIALAALACDNPQRLMLVMPSDHAIRDVAAFRAAVRASVPIAQARWLVTFGIEPTGPETGYGYIEQGDPIVGADRSFAAVRFVEKPNRDNAEEMLAAGGYHWNAGIFLFRADSYLDALRAHSPATLEAAERAMEHAVRDDVRLSPSEPHFAEAPSDSIDYAVMEKADRVAVTPVDPGWSDVGSWDSLFDLTHDPETGNALVGDVVSLESTGNLVHAKGMKVATYGVENLIIVAWDHKVMVLPRGESQNVKALLKLVEANS